MDASRPARADPTVVDLERALLAAFPPLDVHRSHGLVLGASLGVTGRANSACSLGDPLGPVGDAVDAVEAWYRARSLASCVRISPLTPSALVDELARRGYTARDDHPAATLTMATALDPDAPDDGVDGDDDDGDGAVTVSSRRPAGWSTISDRAPRDDDVIAEMLGRVDGDVGWTVRRDRGDEVVAGGRVVVVGDRACVQAMVTRGDRRRQGHAIAVLAGLHTWARRCGARHAFLHVMSTNPAIELYERVGYRPVYEYDYLVAPA